MAGETIAREELVSRLDAAKASIPAKEKAVEIAVGAIRSLPKDAPPSDYVKASGELAKAQTALEGAQSDCDRLARGITSLDVQVKREQIVGELAPKGNSLGDNLVAGTCSWASFPFAVVLRGTVACDTLPAKLAERMAANDVKALVVEINVGEKLISIKPSGAEPRAAKVKGESSANGGRFSARMRATPKGPMNLTQVFREYASEAGVSDERIAMVLADPSNQGISHRGKAVADKLGFEEIPSE